MPSRPAAVTTVAPSAALLDAIDSAPPAESQDKIDKLRAAGDEVRVIDLQLADLAARAGELSARRAQLVAKDIPDLMDQAGATSIDLAADGNKPAVTVEVKPFVTANIAAAWDEEKRQAAFKVLKDYKADDLIKTTLTIPFNREDRRDAVKLVARMRKEGYDVAVDERVMQPTLAAWLRGLVKNNKKLPPLEAIGGMIGRVAKVTPRESP